MLVCLLGKAIIKKIVQDWYCTWILSHQWQIFPSSLPHASFWFLPPLGTTPKSHRSIHFVAGLCFCTSLKRLSNKQLLVSLHHVWHLYLNIDIHLIVLLLGNLINCVSGSRTCGFLQYKSIHKRIILQSRTNKIWITSFFGQCFCVFNGELGSNKGCFSLLLLLRLRSAHLDILGFPVGGAN